MSEYYTIDRANDRLPAVAETLDLLRTQRLELIRLRDRYVRLTGTTIDDASAVDPSLAGAGRRGDAPGEDGTDAGSAGIDEPQLIALRVRAIVDQMGAAVAQLDRWSVALRDIESGLIDFPALAGGRHVWLCWRLGEPTEIAWWHEHEAGFAGRRPLAEIG
ncbi:MAG: hypothetical protein RL338_1822 [Chloroflexota bacterium]